MANPVIAVKNARPLLWVLFAFGTALLVLAIFYFTRQKAESEKKAATNPDAPLDPLPAGTGKQPPVSTPPYVPSNPAPDQPQIPNPGGTSNQNQYATDKYVEEISWKANELLEKNDFRYQCEVTTALAEMPDLQLVALVKNYYSWYEESLPLLFCQKINASACWTSLWDGKAQKACERLKKSAV